MTALLESLQGLGLDAVVTAPAEMAARDPGLHPQNLQASAMVHPRTTAAAATVISWCNRNSVAVVPHGGKTGLVGGGVSEAGQVIVSTDRMDRIEVLDPLARVAVVQSGVPLETLQLAATRHGLEPGIDIGARGSATIGGMVSTNAGGIQAFRHGVMRHRVLGLEVVLPDGSVFSDMTRVIKTTAGYDMKQLFIGAEGTLGLVTRVVVKLEPEPRARATALIAIDDAKAALAVVNSLSTITGATLLAAEMMWRDFVQLNAEAQAFRLPPSMTDAPALLLVEMGGEPDTVDGILEQSLSDVWEQARLLDCIVGGSLEQRGQLWRLREDMETFGRAYPGYMSFDVSVPMNAIDDYLSGIHDRLEKLESGLSALVFGHVADGNLHIISRKRGPYPPEFVSGLQEVLYRDLAAIGGSLTAEHGVGTKKRDAFERYVDPAKRSLIAAVKRTLDPKNLFNPGKIVDLSARPNECEVRSMM